MVTSTWPPWRARASRRGAARPAARPGKWFNDALEGALFAHEEAVKALPPLAAPPTGPKKRVAMAPQRLKLFEAYQRYVRWRPDSKLASKAAYRAAKLSYDHYDYAEAIDLFTRVALDHPAGEEAEYATNLVLDAYNELGDWRNLNGWAKRFYANAALVGAHPKLKDDLPKVIEQSSFKIIEELEKAGGLGGGRRGLPGLRARLARHPAGADRPLQRLGRLRPRHRVDKAMEVRELLLQKFPGDPLAPRCLYDNAEGYEAIADFDRAADAYERYFREWRRPAPPRPRSPRPPQKKDAKAAAAVPAPPAPDAPPAYEEKKATDAIINAAVFRAGLRDWARAEANSQAYLEAWPDGADAARLSLSLADLAARQGQPQKELARLEEYQRSYARTPDDWLAAQHRIARLMEKARQRRRGAAYDQGLEHCEATGTR